MLWVSTINVFGFFGSTFPNSLRAIPGLRSFVSFESMTNCSTFPCGTPLTALRSGAGTYSGPIKKLPSTSSGGFSPVFSTLKGGEPGASNLRTGAAAHKQGPARTAINRTVFGLNMNYPLFSQLANSVGLLPFYVCRAQDLNHRDTEAQRRQSQRSRRVRVRGRGV